MTPSGVTNPSRRPLRRRWPRPRLRPSATALATALLAGAGGLFFAALVGTFLVQSWPAWRRFGLGLLTHPDWFARHGEFGAAAMLYGTLAVATIALVLATPVALGAAAFASEWLGRSGRLVVKSLAELLAGVPSVVYGLLGVLLLRDWVFAWLTPFDPLSGDTLLTAGLLLAVMVLPTLTTLAEDALQGVPADQRRAARALGLTRSETLLRVVAPAALPGLVAAALLALGRALGETVAVFLVVGRLDGGLPDRLLSPAPLAEAGQTLTSKLGGPEVFLAAGDPEHWGALMALGLVLLGTTTAVTVAGLALARSGRRGA